MICLAVFVLYLGSGSSVPLMYSPPTLDAPVIINNGHDFSQTCNINYNGSEPGATFDVTWLFESIPYRTVTLKNGLTSAVLTSADWKGKLGEKLSCSVESYFPSNITSRQHLTSNEYFGGLYFDVNQPTNGSNPMTLNIYEGDPGMISVKSTLPIVCSNVTRDRCTLKFDLTVTSGNPDYIFFDGGCSVTLLSSRWDTVNKNVETSMKISTLIEPLRKADQHFNLTYTLRQDIFAPELFYIQSPFEITVRTHDRSHIYCMVFGASDFIGFRPTRSYRAGMYTGDFLMYKGTDISGKKLQVQIRNWRPVGASSSVCGVAFRYGQTLIKVDMCSSQPNMTAPVITQGESNPDDIVTYLCGSNYEIVAADGVRLSVILNIDHLDVKLHLSPGFTDQDHGACSYHHYTESFLEHDVKQYRISEDKSLFGKAALSFYKVKSNANQADHFCQCGGSNRACSPFHLVADLGSPIAVNRTGMPVVRPGCSVVVPHALDPDITPQDLISSTGVDPNRIMYQFESSQPCEDAIRKHSSSFCLTRNIDKIRFFKDICAKDARFTGDVTKNMASAVKGFHWYCQEHSLAVNGFYSYVNGNLIPAPEVTSEMCSSVCSLHGVCMHGVCACDNGYTGVDCSVKKNTPPVIVDIIGGSKCELSSLKCDKPILVTRNIYPSNNLQVVLNATEVSVRSPGYVTVNLEPVYENRYSVSLPMEHTMKSLKLKDKTVVRYTMKITSDGKLFSAPFDYLVYDDKCQECGLMDGCFLKEDSCHINGTCYAVNEANPMNASQICDSQKAFLHWTVAQQNPSSGTGGSGSVPLIGK